MTYEINVTELDIAIGERGNACLCPIAIAFKRSTDKWCEVSEEYIKVGGFFNKRKLKNNSAVSNFVRDFDTGNAVKPFSFQINI